MTDVEPGAAAPRERSGVPVLRTLLAVAASFFGVRKARDLDRDAVELKPLHVVVAGIALALVFVAALVVLVNWVISSGVAA